MVVNWQDSSHRKIRHVIYFLEKLCDIPILTNKMLIQVYFYSLLTSPVNVMSISRLLYKKPVRLNFNSITYTFIIMNACSQTRQLFNVYYKRSDGRDIYSPVNGYQSILNTRPQGRK
jgi:hypothetical protein